MSVETRPFLFVGGMRHGQVHPTCGWPELCVGPEWRSSETVPVSRYRLRRFIRISGLELFCYVEASWTWEQAAGWLGQAFERNGKAVTFCEG